MASSISAGTTSSTALVATADTSGSLVLQTNNGTTAVTIDTNQRTAFVAGTAALPAITTTGDTNTGIFFPAADTIAFAENGAEAMRIDSSGNLLFNSGYGSVATAYGCRAWVNFNGTGTIAIRGSGNVSSLTDRGTGQYTVNFTSAMPDANYCGVGTVGGPTSSDASTVRIPDDGQNLTTASATVGVARPTVAYIDSTTVQVSFFR